MDPEVKGWLEVFEFLWAELPDYFSLNGLRRSESSSGNHEPFRTIVHELSKETKLHLLLSERELVHDQTFSRFFSGNWPREIRLDDYYFSCDRKGFWRAGDDGKTRDFFYGFITARMNKTNPQEIKRLFSIKMEWSRVLRFVAHEMLGQDIELYIREQLEQTSVLTAQLEELDQELQDVSKQLTESEKMSSFKTYSILSYQQQFKGVVQLYRDMNEELEIKLENESYMSQFKTFSIRSLQTENRLLKKQIEKQALLIKSLMDCGFERR